MISMAVDSGQQWQFLEHFEEQNQTFDADRGCSGCYSCQSIFNLDQLARRAAEENNILAYNVNRNPLKGLQKTKHFVSSFNETESN